MPSGQKAGALKSPEALGWREKKIYLHTYRPVNVNSLSSFPLPYEILINFPSHFHFQFTDNEHPPRGLERNQSFECRKRKLSHISQVCRARRSYRENTETGDGEEVGHKENGRSKNLFLLPGKLG